MAALSFRDLNRSSKDAYVSLLCIENQART